MSKFLIVGLGNPGIEYNHTRHNIGFDVVDAFVAANGGTFSVERLAFRAEVSWKGRKFVCIKPTTFMNLSGRAVRYWLDKEKVPLENMLVIVDDLALPVEKVRLRGKGSDGGHNGLKDITAVLGTEKYPRLRFGIGHDFSRGAQVSFVLSTWTAEELPVIKDKIRESIEIISNWAVLGIDRAMNLSNNKDIK
ncbi:MAG: aminoacyl-tRNA hydrolase [Chitinophagaceae bacterium]|nr:aminoacyl-tRNA hydrolase [Chitinophagaceae bacterium]